MQTIEFVIGASDISPDRFGYRKPCPDCGRPFATLSGLRQHIAAKHDKGR